MPHGIHISKWMAGWVVNTRDSVAMQFGTLGRYASTSVCIQQH